MCLLTPVLLAILFQFPVSGQTPVEHPKPNPKFKDYATGEVFRGRAAKIVWPSDVDPHDPNLQKMREAVQDTIPRKPNFAGHYAIVEYSCGTECSQITVVDLKNGLVLMAVPYDTLDLDADPKVGIPYPGLSYKRNSRLLVASGCFDWDSPESKRECGTKYFELKDDGFALLKYVPGPMPMRLKPQK
jgi:hypothetical protein